MRFAKSTNKRNSKDFEISMERTTTALENLTPSFNLPPNDPASTAVLEERPLAGLKEQAVDQSKPFNSRKPKSWSARIQIWIRRIHLFSGLFMLPWVLLYGFTAMLFNHPNWMTDHRTTVQSFELNADQRQLLPTADKVANAIIAAGERGDLNAQSDYPPDRVSKMEEAWWNGLVIAVVDSDQETTTVRLDAKTGRGTIRRVAKKTKTDSAEALSSGLTSGGVSVQASLEEQVDWQHSLAELLNQLNISTDNLQIRRSPQLEFTAEMDGQTQWLRFIESNRRPPSSMATSSQPASNEANPPVSKQPSISGNLFVVGTNPRDMNWRTYLLRLHMAHGYPYEANTRWFWAIAVDLMFLSMCFWGISGVVMWWQIKRTRNIGWVILILSAVTAIWLAVGMHWDMVHG